MESFHLLFQIPFTSVTKTSMTEEANILSKEQGISLSRICSGIQYAITNKSVLCILSLKKIEQKQSLSA
jgi:hypothetical protein